MLLTSLVVFFCLIFHANEVKKQHPDDVLSFF